MNKSNLLKRIDEHLEFHLSIDSHKSDVAFLREIREFIQPTPAVVEDTGSTTKICPSCGNTQLVLISTQNHKLCTDCGTKINWYKEKGQDAYYK